MINSVYIHIPFCVKKCKYCSFCSFSNLKRKGEYLDALLEEIKFFYQNEQLKTLYFGGGTPSLLEANEISEIIYCFNISSETEVTIELNPNDRAKIKDFYNAGVNRLSIGVQTFDNELLNVIGRTHFEKDIFETIEIAKNAGFENYSIDLMYGLPGQTIDNWKSTLEKAMEILPKHISLYGLKIEEGSYFAKYVPQNLPDADIQAQMYEYAILKLKEKYCHYEFSNFALDEKYFSKHNLTYWNCDKYYGFGLSASGYNNFGRYTNTFNFKGYLKNPYQRNYEKMSLENQIEEEVFLGLRKIQGIDFKKINKKYNIDIYEKYNKVFDKFLSYGFMQRTTNGVCLTQKGVLVSNEILCEFL